MTGWSEIITKGAMQLIDDERWGDDLATDPAQFFRAKSMLVTLALPMLNRPPQLLSFLQSDMTTPLYADTSWTTTPESTTEETTIDTGMVGYELCSVVKRVIDEDGCVALVPYAEATYDAETGKVTFPVQEDDGIQYDIDFYKDGSFPDLSATQFRLFSMAIACVWDERFERNWLNITPKLKDPSFETINEANYMEKSVNRKMTNRLAFSEELRKYEQDCAYTNTVSEFPRRRLI